jgi:hypothetical protein
MRADRRDRLLRPRNNRCSDFFRFVANWDVVPGDIHSYSVSRVACVSGSLLERPAFEAFWGRNCGLRVARARSFTPSFYDVSSR